MNNKIKISFYNFFTVVFAFMTILSLGAISEGVSVFQVLINTGVFSFLTRFCYIEEDRLRKQVKKAKSRRRTNVCVLDSGYHKAA